MTISEIIASIENDIKAGKENLAKKKIGNLAITCKSFNATEKAQFEAVIKHMKLNHPSLFEAFNNEPQLASRVKTQFTEEDFDNAVFELKENFCDERIADVVAIGCKVYGTSDVVIESVKTQETKTAERTTKNSEGARATQNKTVSKSPRSHKQQQSSMLPLLIGGGALIGAAAVAYIMKKIFW